MAILLGGVVLGLAVLINFLFIVKKMENQRYADVLIDVSVLVAASAIYGMSVMGGASATIGSMFISIYLHFFPLKWASFAGSTSDTSTAESTDKTDKQKSWADRFDSMFD